jgi:hypothetical protein
VEKPEVKHLTMTCPSSGCTVKAFVQVLVVPEKELQPKIDARARLKLKKALNKGHKEGAHDD